MKTVGLTFQQTRDFLLALQKTNLSLQILFRNKTENRIFFRKIRLLSSNITPDFERMSTESIAMGNTHRVLLAPD